jgi:hypothetical protein
MGGWRYLAQREVGQGDGGELLDVDLPLTNVTFTDVLSGPAALSGTLAPEFAKLKASDGKPLLTEWGTSIWAEEDGNIIGGGFLVDSRFRGPVWEIDCMGYAGYLSKIPYLDSWSGVEVDPLHVVRLMWEHVRTQPGGDIGLTVSTLTTPVRVGTELKQVEFDTVNGPVSFEAGPAKLNWWTTQDLGQEFDKYAKETPFDYHERHQWEGDVIKHYLDFAYPRMGRRINDLRFVIGENVHTSPEVLRTGADYASEIFGIGAGEGRTQVATRVRANTGRVRRVYVHEDKSARSLKSLNVGAYAEMAWRKNIDAINEITLVDHPHAPMGSVKPGDEILLEGNTGWNEISMWLRVLSTTLRPASGNAMTLSVTPADRIST